MSGGVDSSVAAWLMKEEGYEVHGMTMRLYSYDQQYRKKMRTCCTDRDMEEASDVAERLGIPYEVRDFEVDFKKEVIDKFARVYESGGTPNPCIDCNRAMKFDRMLKEANKRGIRYIVTGHYARIKKDENTGRWLLLKGLDSSKDQSYVLYNLTQEQLAHTRFPVGEHTKERVRQIARENGFANADKKDSQDICFVPDGDYVSFLERYLQKKYEPGSYVDRDGNVIGTHRGAIRYTIGQRKGLGVGFGQPVYVCDKSMEKNTVTLDADERTLFHSELVAGELNWISVPDIKEPLAVTAKTRYHQKEAAAMIFPEGEGTVRVRFEEPQRAITPGQAVVFYDGEVVVGGGTIIAK